MRHWRRIGAAAVLLCAFAATCAFADGSNASSWMRVLSLRDYNTRVVMAGTLLLGAASGLVGSFMLLRRKALLGDAISHATLPGIAIAFMVMVAHGETGKHLPGLLTGAALSGLAGMGLVLLIRSHTRLKEDAAMGVVLSVFFGCGVALLGIIQKMSAGSAAGLESFIYGKTASMLASDGWLIAAFAAGVSLLSGLLLKEFALLCFDPEFARSQGWPVRALDALMMAMVVAVTVVGLQAVGLILVIALLIIPAAAARFWTESLRRMMLIASALGGVSCVTGAALSAALPRLPAGAVIVLVAAGCFLISLLFGTSRGVLRRWRIHHVLVRRVARQHLLRAIFECAEQASSGARPEDLAGVRVSFEDIRRRRSWTEPALRRGLRRILREGLVLHEEARWRLTPTGLDEARRVVRNHRLWELYLITQADVAPSHVDRDADAIEHVLGRVQVAELDRLLVASGDGPELPVSPHPIQPSGGQRT